MLKQNSCRRALELRWRPLFVHFKDGETFSSTSASAQTEKKFTSVRELRHAAFRRHERTSDRWRGASKTIAVDSRVFCAHGIHVRSRGDGLRRARLRSLWRFVHLRTLQTGIVRAFRCRVYDTFKRVRASRHIEESCVLTQTTVQCVRRRLSGEPYERTILDQAHHFAHLQTFGAGGE